MRKSPLFHQARCSLGSRFRGKVESIIGTFVVLNSDGWILTAAHIISAFQEMVDGCEQSKNRPALEAAIKADTSLKPKRALRQT